MSEFSVEQAMADVEQRTAKDELQRPRLIPATSSGGVWDQLQILVDTYGEMKEDEFGIVRRADFAYPRQTGTLRIAEVANPDDLDGKLAYHVVRDDHRGHVDAFITQDGELEGPAIDAIHWDLELYGNQENADLYKKRVNSAVGWLIRPLLILNTARPSLKRHRAFDQSQQYMPKPFLTNDILKQLHKES